MTDDEFQFVATTDEIPENGMKLLEIDDRLVLLVKVSGEVYAIDDVCTHDGGTLCDGKIEGCEIECPRHGARFDVRSGEATKMPATRPTATHPVRVENSKIFIRLNDQD